MLEGWLATIYTKLWYLSDNAIAVGAGARRHRAAAPLTALMVAALGCGGSSDSPPRPEPTTPTVVAADAVTIDADGHPISALGLPTHDIDTMKVMGRSTKDVDAALGKGARRPDGKWRYDIGDGEFVVVVYETGRAVGVEVPTAHAGWSDYDDKQRHAVEVWFHAHGTMNGRATIIGDDFLGVGLALYDEKYRNALEAKAVAAQKIAAEKAAAAQKVADGKAAAERRRAEAEAKIAEQRRLLSMSAEDLRREYLAKVSTGQKFTLTVGGGGTAAVVTAELCNDAILGIFETDLGAQLKTFGFTWLVCADQGSRRRL
jgi:hypothetical protein